MPVASNKQLYLLTSFTRGRSGGGHAVTPSAEGRIFKDQAAAVAADTSFPAQAAQAIEKLRFRKSRLTLQKSGRSGELGESLCLNVDITMNSWIS